MEFERFQAKGRGNRKPSPEELEERHKREIAERDKYIKELEDKVFEQDILGAKKEKKPAKPRETEHERMLREMIERLYPKR